MKASSKVLFLGVDVALQIAALVATILVWQPFGLYVLLGAVWQVISYNIHTSNGNTSKYRRGYKKVAVFTLILLVVGVFVTYIGMQLHPFIALVGAIALVLSALLGALLYLIYAVITFDDFKQSIETCLKHKKQTNSQPLGDWWV